ncbi:MAG TPA: hypothetical protein VHC69_14325 [Polyangiaceae bacterium]|nr:hypothetical protein [Polyangiaceae bacterium]
MPADRDAHSGEWRPGAIDHLAAHDSHAANVERSAIDVLLQRIIAGIEELGRLDDGRRNRAVERRSQRAGAPGDAAVEVIAIDETVAIVVFAVGAIDFRRLVTALLGGRRPIPVAAPAAPKNDQGREEQTWTRCRRARR